MRATRSPVSPGRPTAVPRGRRSEPLCPPCNKALGLLEDDAARLRTAAAYLERVDA
ncbi:endonuclease domain-containing protein [Nocardioides maradonensis]